MKESALQMVIGRLDRMAEEAEAVGVYRVPGLWEKPNGRDAAAKVVNPAVFYGEVLKGIAEGAATPPVRDEGRGPGDWGQTATAYNLLVRYGAAFDHDGDGRISPEATRPCIAGQPVRV